MKSANSNTAPPVSACHFRISAFASALPTAVIRHPEQDSEAGSNLPPLGELTAEKRADPMVGATGAGKAPAAGSMIDRRNETTTGILIEDLIEYYHQQESVVNHVIGSDTQSRRSHKKMRCASRA
jgi:Tfp pilus assembly ATPase PilU